MTSHWTLTGQLNEGGAARSISLQAFPFRVGRRSDLSLCLSRSTVSSVHAEFIVSADSLVLRDLGSTNGTFINGQRVVGERAVSPDDLVQFADMPFRVQKQGESLESRTMHEDVCDMALALVQFDKLLTERALVPYLQPIVDLATRRTLAYEVLGRSRLVGLETPAAMFRAAAQLNLEVELSKVMRIEGLRVCSAFPTPPHVFVNTHPLELLDAGLFESLAALRQVSSNQPITIEIHEAAVTDVATMKRLRTLLDGLNMRLAFDDFGSGQARLAELAEVRPHYLKFDWRLVHDIHRATAERQGMLAQLVKIVIDLGGVALAEGIECEAEGFVCQEMGFELAQGFHYGRPAPVSAYSQPPSRLIQTALAAT